MTASPALRSPLVSVLALFLALGAVGSTLDENRLKNGDFETGGRSLANWNSVYPAQLADPVPEFGPSTKDPQQGSRAASIRVEYSGGYSSFTQEVAVGREDRSLHLEAFARIDDPSLAGAASLLVYFDVPGGEGSTAQSKRLTSQSDWTALSIDAAIPEGTRSLLVRCGVLGPCAASFDDVRLTISKVAVVAGKLAVAHGDYTAKATGKTKNGFVRLSIPFPLGGQTPLAIRVTSVPANKVASLRIAEDRENRPLEVELVPLDSGEEVALRVETLALLRDRPLSDGKGVGVGGRGRPPKDVKLHLESAPGIDAEDPQVRKIAAGFSDDDFASLMGGVTDYLREHLEYAGGSTQGAVECLESGKAVCTGYANTAASLLIARKVPTRVLACTGLGARLQEHYIVESWTEELGWSRMESTAARFPWPDSENLVLRIVYPDAERSVADVPLYFEGGRNVRASARMGKDDCWQGSEVLSTHGFPEAVVLALETAARARFEELLRKPEKGPAVDLLAKAEDLPEEARAVAATVAAWRNEAR